MTSVAFPFAVWYRIHGHEAFRDDLAYRAMGLVCFGETAWSQLFFVSDRGHTVGVQVHRCTALPPISRYLDEWTDKQGMYCRNLLEGEPSYPAAGKFRNPDIDTDR